MKVKNRYILQPTQNSFIESCPLGEKLIKKMGWKNGQSLGSKGNGIKECIKLKYQIETRGLGYQINQNGHLPVLNDDFDNLLTTLNQQYNKSCNKPIEQTLEKEVAQITKKIKSKHRYTKHSRNKDIKNYTETDIKEIIGI